MRPRVFSETIVLSEATDQEMGITEEVERVLCSVPVLVNRFESMYGETLTSKLLYRPQNHRTVAIGLFSKPNFRIKRFKNCFCIDV
jgi:hypothetical protein